LLRQLVKQYKVFPNLIFMLLTWLWFPRAFINLCLNKQYICMCLLAFIVLLKSNLDHEDLIAFFKPKFVDELVSLLRCEETILEDIYILALLALATHTQNRPRQFNILNIINVGGHWGILPNFM
jgi:E3 ubiquitin-protein ligase HUWE1